MKFKIEELIGPQLDRAVGMVLGYEIDEWGDNRTIRESSGAPSTWNPSSDWSQGGPIIERERIAIEPFLNLWQAVHADSFSGNWPPDNIIVGDTPLAAAMRAYVASKFGEDVDLPE